MVTAVERHGSDRSDLQLLVDFGRRNWWVIPACVAGSLVLAVIYLAVRQPSYRATAIMLIQPQSSDADSREVSPATPELVRSQLEILQSQRVLDAAVDRLKLPDDPEFTRGLDSNASRPLRAAAASEALLDRIDAENDGRSYIIRLSAKDSSPDKAARIANIVASAFIDVQQSQKVKTIERTRTALEGRLADLRNQTAAAEMMAEEYRRRSGLIPLSSVPEDSESYAASTPASREIIEMSKDHASLATSRAEAQARYASQQGAIAAGQGQSTAEVISSPVVADLRSREAERAQRLSELEARYGPEHPLVRPARQELAQIQKNIAAEVQRIHSSVASQAAASSQAFRSGDAFMGQLEAARSRDLAAATRLNLLQREAHLKRENYEEYAKQMQRTTERAGLQLPDVILVSPASRPYRPSGAHASLVLAIAALLGLLVGLAAGFARSLLADRRFAVRTSTVGDRA